MLKKYLGSVLLIFCLAACAHQLKLVDMESAQVIYGTYNKADRSVIITLPTGEVLTGQYSALSNASVSVGSLFYGSKVATGYSVSEGGTSKAYAILTGDRGTIMEIMVDYSAWNHQGYGEARTKDGKVYKVQF